MMVTPTPRRLRPPYPFVEPLWQTGHDFRPRHGRDRRHDEAVSEVTPVTFGGHHVRHGARRQGRRERSRLPDVSAFANARGVDDIPGVQGFSDEALGMRTRRRGTRRPRVGDLSAASSDARFSLHTEAWLLCRRHRCRGTSDHQLDRCFLRFHHRWLRRGDAPKRTGEPRGRRTRTAAPRRPERRLDAAGIPSVRGERRASGATGS